MAIQFPPTLRAFFRALEFANINFLPNLAQDTLKIEDNFDDPPLPFLKEEMGTSFLINASEILLLCVLVLCSFILAQVCTKLFPKSKFCKSLKKMFIFSAFLRFGIESSLELLLAILLQFRDLSSSFLIDIAAIVLCIIAAMYLLLLIVLVIWKVWSPDEELIQSEYYKDRYGSMYDQFDIGRKITRCWLAVAQLRRFLFVGALVWLYSEPLAQAISVVSIFASYLVGLICIAPYNQLWLGNRLAIFTEAAQTIAAAMFPLFHDSIGLSRDTHDYVGYAVIFVVLLAIIVNIFAVLISSLVDLISQASKFYSRMLETPETNLTTNTEAHSNNEI